MPAKNTVITIGSLPAMPTMSKRPVILSLRNPFPGDTTRVSPPKQGLGMPPANTRNSFTTSSITLPVSGMGVPPGVLQAPTPIPGRLPTKVRVPKKKEINDGDKHKDNTKDKIADPQPSKPEPSQSS